MAHITNRLCPVMTAATPFALPPLNLFTSVMPLRWEENMTRLWRFSTRLMLSVAAGLAVVVGAGPATAIAQSTLLVDDDLSNCPDATFTTIQAAVNAALPGDTIFVCRGTYSESVVITTAGLTLEGSKAVVEHKGILKGSHAFNVQANNTTIRFFTIVGDNRTNTTLPCDDVANGLTGNGIQIGSTSTVVTGASIEGNEIVDGRRGINLEAMLTAGVSPLTSHVIHSNVVESTCGGGIRLSQVAGNTIEDNLVSDAETRPGIPMPNGDGNTVDRNVLRRNTDTRVGQAGGISVANLSTGNLFEGNKMKDNIGQNGDPLDALDASVGGGTAGTANTWDDNKCKFANPSGLCKH